MDTSGQIKKSIKIIWVVMLVIPILFLILSFMLPEESIQSIGAIVFDGTQYQNPQVQGFMRNV